MQWFSAQAAQNGGVIRRDIWYVEKYTSMAEVKQEAMKRRWHVVIIGEQVVVICSTGEMQVVC